MVGQAASNSDMQKAAVEAVEREMMRKAELFEAQRADKMKYQMLLLEVPQKPIPKAVLEPEPEVVPEVVPEPVAEVQPEVVETPAPEETVEAPPVEETAEHAAEATDETAAEETADESEEEALGEGEIEIREGETLAEIKERIRKEQQKAKKPTIPPELLNTANSYEDKVGVVRMVVQTDQTRVASVIRGMIQVNK
jgi:outer membrane biosynthesis protein TonB